MVAVLLTGMSGVGKSTMLAALAARGRATVDTDEPGWKEIVDGEPLWREDRRHELLQAPRSAALFVGGTVANQGRFRDRFDVVVLLTAPLDVLLERIRTRTTNGFGRTEEERAAVVRDHRHIEPVLRANADLILDATRSLDSLLAALEELVSPSTTDP